MKKPIFTLAITALIAGTVITGCESSAKKVKDAENKVEQTKLDAAEAKINLNQQKEDSINEYKQFKKESEEKIADQEKSITEFKARIAKEKKENRAQYETKLAKLEQKNTDLKKRLDDYKYEGKDKWIAFKKEFKHDLDELGQAFKDFTIKNVK